jgi:hypothetical protein
MVAAMVPLSFSTVTSTMASVPTRWRRDTVMSPLAVGCCHTRRPSTAMGRNMPPPAWASSGAAACSAPSMITGWAWKACQLLDAASGSW